MSFKDYLAESTSVINKGGLTIKTSWSRMTVAGLVEAIQEECPIYRRVCRPEVYRTRLLCYRTLKAVCEEAETESNNPSAAEFVNERFHTLSRLVPVFDEVLASEWSPQNLTIPHYTGRHMPSCDFCGADIFQSFFQCKECSEFENNMEGETYHICATCYVEGRSCVCRVMSPVQHRPFEVLLDVRNNAAGLYHQDADFDAIDKEFLAQMISNRVFRAAMALYTSRTLREEDSPKVTRIRRCSAVVSKQDLSHDAPAESLARCGQNGCKRALCFLHSLILRRSHSSDDILDTESVLIYHSKHGGSLSNSTVIPNVKDEFNGIFGVDYKKPYIKRRPGVITKGVPNGPLKPYIRLTWAAITFPYCQPIDAQRSYPGWYDKERSRVPREVLIEANGEAASDVGDVGSDALSAMSVNQESDGYTPQTASRKRTKSRTKLPKSRKSRKGKEVATSSDSGEMQESMDSLDDWDNAFSPHPSRRPAKRPRYTNIADHGVEAPEAGPSRLDQGSNLSSEDRIVVHPRSKLLDETESSTLTPLNEEAENATIIDPGELSLPDFGVPLGLAEDDNRTFLIDAYNEICRTACDSRGLNKARLLSQLERMGRILRAPSPYKTPTEFMGMAKTLPKFDVRMSLAQPNGSDSVSGSVSTADTPE
ncbi:hypothetical protein FRB99_006020 [Tulasnella sp. 403]|nr:hypothetical protein FRB99_006020 [Tulasnella sp. 403]